MRRDAVSADAILIVASTFWSVTLASLAVAPGFLSAPRTRSPEPTIFSAVHSIFSAGASSFPDDAAKVFLGAIRISVDAPSFLFLTSIFSGPATRFLCFFVSS
jgi:hypothetical protein